MLISTAGLVGGDAHMRAVSLEMREYYAYETFKEWEHG